MNCSSGKEEPITKEKGKVVLELQHTYPLKVLLTVSRLSRSTDYYNVSCIDKDLKNDDIMNEMIAIYYTHQKRYGYRSITLKLTNKGYRVNHKKGKRLMSVMGLYGIKAKRNTSLLKVIGMAQ